MADFLSDLWGSIFTSGPTPTLLLATNVTFAALQALLAALLFATYSIHFVILSVLCGGLWYAINWFAHELKQAQAKEEEAERLRKQKKGRDSDWKTKGEVGDSADDEGEDTETEGAGMKESATSIAYEPTKEDERVRSEILDAMKASGNATMGGASSGLQPGKPSGTTRQRRGDDGERSGEISSSTDSEWEKVDDDR